MLHSWYGGSQIFHLHVQQLVVLLVGVRCRLCRVCVCARRVCKQAAAAVKRAVSLVSRCKEIEISQSSPAPEKIVLGLHSKKKKIVLGAVVPFSGNVEPCDITAGRISTAVTKPPRKSLLKKNYKFHP